MELKLSQSSLPTAIFNSSSSSLQHFQRWKLEIERISRKGQDMSNKTANHVVVKEGETLTSISKLPILENLAAANKEIADVDLVFQGQNRNIFSAVARRAEVWHSDETELHEHQLPDANPSSGFHSTQPNQIFTVLSSHRLPLAKSAGAFLVLVPLMAFCIRCIIGAFQDRVSRNLRHQAANKSVAQHSKSNSMRWKSVLDAESEPDSRPLLEDQEQLHFEDASHAYTKLEDDYQKFLSECGMSNWGYWRGGSPK